MYGIKKRIYKVLKMRNVKMRGRKSKALRFTLFHQLFLVLRKSKNIFFISNFISMS